MAPEPHIYSIDEDDDEVVEVIAPGAAAMPTRKRGGAPVETTEAKRPRTRSVSASLLQSDYMLAQSLQATHQHRTTPASTIQSDHAYALALFEEEKKEVDPDDMLGLGREKSSCIDPMAWLNKRKEHEDKKMFETAEGRAYKVVEQVIDLHEEMKNVNSELAAHMSVVAMDDLVDCALKMQNEQETFRREGKPCKVDIGYHYTQSRNMSKIGEEGLLTKAERDSKNIKSKYNGSSLGDGIYTANDPFATNGPHYGDTGLMVARLQGKTGVQHLSEQNKTKQDTYSAGGFVVMRKSSQCVPLVQFKSTLIDMSRKKSSPGNKFVADYAKRLQAIVNQFYPNMDDSKPAASKSAQKPAAAKNVLKRAAKYKAKAPPKPVKKPAAVKKPPKRAAKATAKAPPKPAAAVKSVPKRAAKTTAKAPPKTEAAVKSVPKRAAKATAKAPPKLAAVKSVPKRAAKPTAKAPPKPAAVKSAPKHAAAATPKTAPNSKTAPKKKAAPRSTSKNASNPATSTTAAAAAAAMPPSSTVPRSILAHTSKPLPDSGGNSQTLKYTAPKNLDSKVPDDAFCDMKQPSTSKNNCTICWNPLHCPQKQERCVFLAACRHEYHFSCIEQAMKTSWKCPICRKQVGTPVGKMPSGTMTVSVSDQTCKGFRKGTIAIQYSITGGVQKSYHDNPGKRYGSTARTAYLPSDKEGVELLKRLKFAFLHGLTFTVGTSLTTNQPNTVTWSSIHHKTSPSGGVHGFPDKNYFTNCNQALDALGVPSSEML